MTKAKRDVQQEITDLVIKAIENGVQPWSRPWSATNMGYLARRHCGTPYKGINQFLLGMYQATGGFSSCYWMTYRQAQKLGGQVRKGEKSNLSVFFKVIEKTDKAGEITDRFGFYKANNVFNAAQIDGLPERFYPKPVEAKNPDIRDATTDAWFAALPTTVNHGGGSAHLSLRTGQIQMPDFAAFHSALDYYSTLAHETVHWSGMKRNEIEPSQFGSLNYAKEELVAEMGAAFTLAHLGLASKPREDHASYIKAWLDKLKGDKKFIFSAASQAQARVDHLTELAERKEAIAA